MKILICNKFLSLFILPMLIAGCFLYPFAGTAHSQAPGNAKKDPLHIVSDKMVATKEGAMVEFIGNVKATQTDSVLLANSVKVFFSDTSLANKDQAASASEATQQGRVKKIISTGNVKFTSGDRKAFADKAVYTTEDGKLILTGNSPKLVTGTSSVTGKKITLFRNQEKVIVESDGSKRVEALFNPEDNPTEKQ